MRQGGEKNMMNYNLLPLLDLTGTEWLLQVNR